MGKQDVRQALVAMDRDETVREKLAAGDFAAVDGLDLDADERMLVQDAANDMPEVSGFAADFFATIDGVKNEPVVDKLNIAELPWKWQVAVKYTSEKI
jgi:glutamate synthase domain-containing protein 1